MSNQIYSGTDSEWADSEWTYSDSDSEIQVGDSDRNDLGDDRYIHLKDVYVDFIKSRPTTTDLELVFKDDAGVKHKSSKFNKNDLVHWKIDIYVRTHSCAALTIQQALFEISVAPCVAQIDIEFKPNKFRDWSVIGLQDSDTNHLITVSLVCGRSQSLEDVARILGFHWQAYADLASMVPRILKLPQLAVLSPPTSERGYNAPYPAIHWLNNDILLGVFDYYRLDEVNDWNVGLGWCNLSHVCQRWRHLIYECAFHLGLRIKCTNGSPTLDTLDHLPPLPLFIDYAATRNGVTLTEQDELGIYHALRLHDRAYHIDLELLPSILHKVFVLLDEQFPILEHLSVTFSATSINNLPPTLPKTFLAPNLRHLALPSINPPRRLRLLTSTVSLVTLELSEIQTSSYFRPRLLLARLRSLPQLEELYIGFSIPIPRPSTESELLGEQGAPITLPSLKTLKFRGVGAYLESLVAQIRAPLVERLEITLFNQIAFAFPHLFHLINTTEGFRFSAAVVSLSHENVDVAAYIPSPTGSQYNLHLSVICIPLDWKIDCASQICHALIPALSGVERIRLNYYYILTGIRIEWQNGEIDGTTWHDLLRSFIGVKELYIHDKLLEELSCALRVDEVGSDPGFLPNLQTICASRNPFTSFIDTRQVVGRPVQFEVGYNPY